tara:strand:- start:57 stop:740 length:684 start_codon:yes stop_codon:yes gene_type:complete
MGNCPTGMRHSKNGGCKDDNPTTEYQTGGRMVEKNTNGQYNSVMNRGVGGRRSSGRRPRPQPTLKRNLNLSKSVEISFEAANNEVDNAGNIIRVVKPYNINSIVNRVKDEYQQRVGKPMSQSNLMELTNIIKLSQGFIGAHYHTLNEWARDNMDIVIPTLGLKKGENGQVMFPDCTGSCSSSGLGSCNSVCAGAICDTVPGVTDHGTGNTIVPSSKTYGIKIRIALH